MFLRSSVCLVCQTSVYCRVWVMTIKENRRKARLLSTIDSFTSLSFKNLPSGGMSIIVSNAQWSDYVVRWWKNYFQSVLIDKIAFFYIHMAKENLHPSGIWVHSILNSLEPFFFICFKKNLHFEHFFSIIVLK